MLLLGVRPAGLRQREARPSTGASAGDNWMQKERTGDYVPDDYRDARLLNYDDLFRAWEQYLRFQIGGVERDRTPGAPPARDLIAR